MFDVRLFYYLCLWLTHKTHDRDKHTHTHTHMYTHTGPSTEFCTHFKDTAHAASAGLTIGLPEQCAQVPAGCPSTSAFLPVHVGTSGTPPPTRLEFAAKLARKTGEGTTVTRRSSEWHVRFGWPLGSIGSIPFDLSLDQCSL